MIMCEVIFKVLILYRYHLPGLKLQWQRQWRYAMLSFRIFSDNPKYLDDDLKFMLR